MDHVDQSARDLRYYLVPRDTDVEALEVIRQLTFTWSGITVEMGILGASHYLKFRLADGRIWTEVFACADLELQGAHISCVPFEELPAQITVPLNYNEWEYGFTPGLVTWSEAAGGLVELQTAIRNSNSSHTEWGLQHQFPSLEGDPEDKPPLTLLYAGARGSDLKICTSHCYPNEDNVVFTLTTLLNSNGGSKQ